MRRGRLLAGVIVVLAVCALGASAALAATPQQICQDLQDGRLDGQYSAADLAAFKADASVQGYCFLTVTPSNTPSGNAAPSAGKGTTGGVAGAAKPASAAGVAGVKASAPLATTKAKSGGLPFTGAQLTVALLISGALLAGGLLLRVAARRGAG
ncbi:MAG TPA: hypothetical protein VGJ25_02175 [Gaiellaceae bacterium]|jgi:hypothetical protein